MHKSNCRDASSMRRRLDGVPRGVSHRSIRSARSRHRRERTHWLIYAQANTVFRKCALLWRDVIASSQSDVLYDALLSASLEILQRLDLRYDERMLEDEMRC